jgi:hypothetical protein
MAKKKQPTKSSQNTKASPADTKRELMPEEQEALERDIAVIRQWEADEDTLAELNRLNDLIRDRVRTVALRFQTAAYIVGRPGTGKTHTVTHTLEGMVGVGWTYRNARLSPAALYELIEQYQDSVIVIDDVPLLFKNVQAVQILLAAVGGDPGKARRVTYSTKGDHRNCDFRGGIVAISNEPITKKDPLGQALGSRGAALHHEPTDEMMAAMIRTLARESYKGLPVAECREVADFVIRESRAADYRLDLRYFTKGIEDFLYTKTHRAYSDWRELVRSSLKTFALTERVEMSPRDRRSTELRRIVVELEGKKDMTPGQRVDEFKRRTGGSQAAYYRHRAP